MLVSGCIPSLTPENKKIKANILMMNMGFAIFNQSIPKTIIHFSK
jgi:hypothetical protein